MGGRLSTCKDCKEPFLIEIIFRVAQGTEDARCQTCARLAREKQENGEEERHASVTHKRRAAEVKAEHSNKMEYEEKQHKTEQQRTEGKRYDLEKEKVMKEKEMEIEKEITRREIEVEREKTKRETIILEQTEKQIILQQMKMACELNNDNESEIEDKHDVGDISRFYTRPQTLMY